MATGGTAMTYPFRSLVFLHHRRHNKSDQSETSNFPVLSPISGELLFQSESLIENYAVVNYVWWHSLFSRITFVTKTGGQNEAHFRLWASTGVDYISYSCFGVCIYRSRWSVHCRYDEALDDSGLMKDAQLGEGGGDIACSGTSHCTALRSPQRAKPALEYRPLHTNAETAFKMFSSLGNNTIEQARPV